MKFRTRILIFALILCREGVSGQAPCFGLTADAGPDLIYSGSAITMGVAVCGTGGTAPLSYNWTPSAGIVGPSTICAPNVAPSATTKYTLSVTDNVGCISQDEVLVVNILEEISYVVPKKTIDAGYCVPKNNKVYFRIEEEYRTGTLAYTITDYDPSSSPPAVVSCALSPGSTKNLGDNRYYIDLASCGLIPSRFYIVELKNDKNEKFYFKFLN